MRQVSNELVTEMGGRAQCQFMWIPIGLMGAGAATSRDHVLSFEISHETRSGRRLGRSGTGFFSRNAARPGVENIGPTLR